MRFVRSSLLLATAAVRRQTATAFAPHTSHSNLHSARAVPASRSTFSTTSLAAMPICIVVEAEIKEDRMDDFLDMIEKNAVGSRAEPGCIRFDVLQAEDQANKFFFYEVYEDAAAIAHHKEQAHYLAWGAFKESGGTLSSVSKKASGKYMT
ncbi:hypothetical protein ACHAXT_010760 [Thalassiosira profunda]